MRKQSCIFVGSLLVWLAVLVACGEAETAVPLPAPEAIPSPTAPPTATPTIAPPPTLAPTSEPSFALEAPFALNGGAQMQLADGALTLHFTELLEDSRCPLDVDCFWSGQARFLIEASAPGQPPLALEFNTNPAPDQTVDSLPAYGYTVQLIQLDPYPEKAAETIPFANYQAQLVVTMGK
jgi:hypothetical protein